MNSDTTTGGHITSISQQLRLWGEDINGCLKDSKSLGALNKIMTRKIRYWECRPMPGGPGTIVSPADSRALVGAQIDTRRFPIKGKSLFFKDLLGMHKKEWLEAFQGGHYGIFRLTPEKYHYIHVPAAGRVLDFYNLCGEYTAYSPDMVVNVVTPRTRNKRYVTIVNTEVPGGASCGLVAMIEIVTPANGDLVQCYSSSHYDYPVPVRPGIFLEKGQPKSIFTPGNGTAALLFQKNRVLFGGDSVTDSNTLGTIGRFSQEAESRLVETEVRVRSQIGRAIHS